MFLRTAATSLVTALVVAALLAFESQAEPTQNNDDAAVRPIISDLTAARLLMKAGKFQGARAFLEQTQPTNEEEEAERRFLLGQVYLRLGMPRNAAEQFEAILSTYPDFTRVRLELARAHFAAGRDDEAKQHFELALGGGLPSSVETTVEGFLGAIDARKRWSAHLSGALLPETNVVRRTDRQTIDIGGGRFELNEDARQASGIGAQVSAGAAFSPMLSTDTRGHLAISSAAKVYKRSEWNDISVIAEGGLTRLFDRGNLSGGIRVGRRWVGSRGFRRSVGPWASFYRRTSSKTHIDVRTNVDYRVHDDGESRDGWRIAVNPGVRYTLDNRTTLKANAHLEAIEARAEHRSSRLIGMTVGLSRGFRNLSVSLSASAQLQGYQDQDPLFGRKRRDKTAWLSGKVLHRGLHVAGFSPYMGYSYERSRSNISLYDYQNHSVSMGFSRRF